jgi:predicted ATPase/DNA-binding winged helix-turn-helix (wHTH) protein
MSVRSDSCVMFGPFRLFPNARIVEKDGVALQLGSRALDILIVLVERAGEVVSQKQLITRVWRGLRVDPSALRVQMTALRKALGDGQNGARYVATIPSQGYSFVAPINHVGADEAPILSQLARSPRNHLPGALPPALARMVGRDEAVRAITEELLQRGFVTLVGPGGIGKTTVATAVAHRVLKSIDGFVCFVDFAAVTDPAHACGTVAESLGLEIDVQDRLPNLIEALRANRGVLILDNCEHVISRTASLAEQIILHAPGIHILATSREALRVEGEHLYQLAPLACPPAGSSPSAATAESFAAVQLFMDRANAGGSRTKLTDAEAPIVADICNRLDGIALAIELAAGRVGAYGIRGTSSLLDGHLELGWRGKRTATPRHQTLCALLDWSYELLPETERVIFRRLSVFVGPFDATAAEAVSGPDKSRRMAVAESLDGLVAKSLLSTIVGSDGVPLYRLLETTRTYAVEKLHECGETQACAKRHATYFLDFLARTADGNTLGPRNWSAIGNSQLGNVRAALEWCFGADGDEALGVALAARASHLFLSLSLIGECHRWSVKALAQLDGSSRGTERELDLQKAVAISSLFIRGDRTEVMGAFHRGLELAKALGRESLRLRLLSGLHHYLTRMGKFQAALAVAQRWRAAVSTTRDEYTTAVSDWMLAISYHLIGDQAAAQRYCESGFAQDGMHPSDGEFSGFDHRVRALATLARTLWLRGYATQSISTARRALEEAARGDRPVNVCLSLVYVTPVFIWCGDWKAAAELLERLINYAPRYGFSSWRAVGEALKGEFLVRTGRLSPGIALLENGLRVMKLEHYLVQAGILTGSLAEGLGKAGRGEEALATITVAIEQGELNGDPYDMPELLRIKGELLAAGGQTGYAEAERYLRRSLELAHRQSAVGWELRAATGLARLLENSRRSQDALAILDPIYSQFDEGFETADLCVAADLLASLSRSDRGRSGARRSGAAGQ